MSKLNLQQLDEGIDAALANASSLIKEATLLLRSGFHARAYTLSHIAREEIAKVTMLYTCGLRMLVDHPVNWSKLHKRLRDHRSKLTSDALVSFVNTAVNTPSGVEMLQLEMMLAGTTIRNEWKNESLYIALKDNHFKTPSQVITPQKAERTIGLATVAFEDAKRYLLSGGKLTQREPEEAKKMFANINPDKLKPEDALALIKELSMLIHSAAKSSGSTRFEGQQSEVVEDCKHPDRTTLEP
jgi:AbiV family abortive infection protein